MFVQLPVHHSFRVWRWVIWYVKALVSLVTSALTVSSHKLSTADSGDHLAGKQKAKHKKTSGDRWAWWTGFSSIARRPCDCEKEQDEAISHPSTIKSLSLATSILSYYVNWSDVLLVILTEWITRCTAVNLCFLVEMGTTQNTTHSCTD